MPMPPAEPISPAPALPSGAWEGRETFRDLVRQALAQAAEEGWKTIVLADADFADWPLGERDVVASLEAWARGGRQLHWLARDFGPLRAHAPRTVAWRVTWDHLVQARACAGVAGQGMPSAIWSPGWSLERIDTQRARGVTSDDPKRCLALKERLDGFWQRGTVAFSASVLGL